MKKILKISKDDNVAVALTDLKAGDEYDVDGEKVILLEKIERGHKFLLKDLRKNEKVVKYAFPIGYMTENVLKGSHIHTHNLRTTLEDNPIYAYNPKTITNHIDIPLKNTFEGYERKDKRVGIRNEIWIVPTVGCVNSIAKEIEKRCQNLVSGNIDAIVAFNHPYGCSQMGDDQENTREALAGLITHPNAGGVLVLGLGCENSNILTLRPYLKDFDEERVRFLACQEVEDEIYEACKIIKELSEVVSKDERSQQSVSKLVVGLKCGGSDGLSGITANPTVGCFSDYLTGCNGSTILTEVPEMFGAESLLMERAVNKEVFEKTVFLINDFKEYYRKNNQPIYENPSPGNKKGGISTLEDKALGCTQKSGTSAVVDVLKYGERITANGLNLLSAPGNDLVASTALAVSGAQIIIFTTGRGTPFSGPVPTVKVSSNTDLAAKKNNWIDFDCGVLFEDEKNIADLGLDLYEYVLKVANGEKVKSEKVGYRDMAIFKKGVTL